MALTPLQRAVCHLLAARRVTSGESYVAGGVALNELLSGSRVSRDIDLFHDTEEALEASWQADRQALVAASYEVHVLRERPGWVEAEVERWGDSVRVEWARDSAFRFFPLVEHAELGLALHPFDLATNKLLALVGRREVRDWVDLIHCDAHLQPLGYLAWAACGKDPGFSPVGLVDLAARAGRFASPEVAALAYDGEPPDAGELSRQWHAALTAAGEVLEILPPDETGKCVLTAAADLARWPLPDLAAALERGHVRFHPGSIRGAWPSVS